MNTKIKIKVKRMKIIFIRITLFLLFIQTNINAYSQIDTKFWFAAPDISQGHGDIPINFIITSFEREAVIKISLPANKLFQPIELKIPPFTSLSYDVSALKEELETRGVDVIKNTGISITSTNIVSITYSINSSLNPEIFSLKGTNALGTEFIIPSQKHGYTRREDAYNAAYILATEDNTIVTITPSNNLFGHKKGEPFNITLNTGQVYVLAASDVYHNCCFWEVVGNQIGGTKLTSNKLITVTHSDDSISLSFSGCQDLNGDQLLPTSLSGNQFITLPGFLNVAIWEVSLNNETTVTNNVTDIVYIYPTMDNTSLKINGKLIEYKKNIGDYFYLLNKGDINYFESDKPVLVYQLSGNGCEVGGAVIPEISRTGLNFSSATRITEETLIINLLMESKYTAGLKIEGLKSEILLNWKNIGEKWSVASLDLTDSKFIKPNETIYFKNELGPFHLGMIHGGGGSGTRFGFFSNFSIALDTQILTASCRDELAVFTISDPRGTSGFWQISEDNSLTWKDIASSVNDFEVSGLLNNTLRIKNKAFIDGLLVRYVEVNNSRRVYSYPSRLNLECPTINFSNVITRNNDSKNDKFIAKGLENFKTNELIIFDRWGNHVYKTKDYQNDWGGEGLVSGTYYYILHLEDKNRNLIEYKGWIQLITK